MKKGDLVKFNEIVDPGDDEVRMVLLEDPDGGKVLVEALVELQFNPTYVYQVNDLVKYNELTSA